MARPLDEWPQQEPGCVGGAEYDPVPMSGEDRFDEQPLVGAGGFEPPEPARPSVERRFKRNVAIGEVDLPDWEFIAKVVELLRPYAKVEDSGSFSITGEDKRGSYDAADLDAFRAEYDERREKAESVMVRAFANATPKYGMYAVYLWGRLGLNHSVSGKAELTDEDEIRVNGLAARIETFARDAEERKKNAALRKKQEAAAQALASTHVAASLDAPSTPWWNNTWLVAVVGGVVAALIAALVVWLISSH